MFQISSEVLRYLSTAPATILVAPDAPKFTILYANPAYHQATLTTPEDIVGLGFLEAFPESPVDAEGDNVQVLRDSLIKCVQTRSRVELPGKRYDVPVRGTAEFVTKYWQASNNPVFDENGQIAYISHVTVEITGAYDLARKERIAREVTEAKRRDLHSLLMEAPAAIAILEATDLVFEFENATHKAIFGDRQAVGKIFTDAFPEFKETWLLQNLQNILIKGETYEQKEVKIGKAGTSDSGPADSYWNFIYKPRYNSVDVIDGIIIFGYDVTGQVQSRRKVEESEERLQTILETMAEGICIVDKEGRIIYSNPMAGRLLGMKKEALINRRFDDSAWNNLKIDGTELSSIEHPVAITLTTGEPVFDFEISLPRFSNERFFISVNAAPLKDEAGRVTGAIGTFMDVTQRRKSVQMKDEFISTVSHEIKTPLTSIKAYLQMLDKSLSGDGDSNNRRFLNRLGVQVNRLESLIKDFLDVTRLDSDKMSMHSAEFEMNLLLEDLVRDLQLLTPSHRLFIAQNDLVTVFTDQNRIIQVLTNLITNAVKYSPQATEVLIISRRDKSNLVCSVQDFGVGIPENQHSLVFQRFHQAGDNKGAGLSLGLGLYISKEIVEKAGGKIWLKSAPGEGSTFFFSLPLK